MILFHLPLPGKRIMLARTWYLEIKKHDSARSGSGPSLRSTIGWLKKPCSAQEDIQWVKLSYVSDLVLSLTQVAKLYCLPLRNDHFIETKWTSEQRCFVIKFTMYSMSAMPSKGLQTFAWLKYVTMTELINFKVDCILCWNHAQNDRRIAVRL